MYKSHDLGSTTLVKISLSNWCLYNMYISYIYNDQLVLFNSINITQ